MSKSKSFIICITVAFIIFLFLGHNKAKGSLSGDIDANWWAKAQKNIQESEYEIRWQEKSSEYQSPNRDQNLRFSYYPDGFKVRPRVKGDKWSVDIRLMKYGRKSNMLSYKGNNISVEKRKANVKGNGINIEFENGKKGMREDFVVERKGRGRGNLILEFDVSNHNVKMVVKENEINFVMSKSGGAEILRYSDMKITDNRDKILKGYFKSIDDNRFAVVVDDRDAEYPIRIDPLSSTQDWTAESNQIGACFGGSVSTAGDVNGDGYSDVIVGAPWYDNGEVDEGRAYVYYGSVSGLSSTPDWTAESDQVDVYFGRSVSTAGDINGDGYSDVIIGADCYTNGHSEEGMAYVYYGSASGLSQIPDWTAESNQEDANFGWSVSTAGDVNGDGYSDVIVGAYRYDNGEMNEGRAYVYYGSSSGLSLVPDWTAESDQADANFGWSVSTAGDVNGDGYSDVIVGAYGYDNGETDEGRAFVYYGSSSGLSQTPDWTGESDQIGAGFGVSVSTAGDVNGDGCSDVIIGAYSYDNGEMNEGRAFVYYGSSSGLSLTPDWTAESNQADAYFGISVSIAGDVNGDGYSDVIIGAYYYDNAETNEGRAFVYYGSASGLSQTPEWTAESNQIGAHFGWSVSTAGDVNGDGYSDVIVGAYRYDNGETNEGRAYVYYGSASGLSQAPDWTGESDQVYAFFGISVSTAGDVNGDGYSDVIVGANWYDNGQSDEGRAFAYYGSASGLSQVPDWTGESNQSNANFGISVSTAGDVNGDGYSDVIISAPNSGMVFAYYGSISGLSQNPDWTAESDQTEIIFGKSVSTAGDVNGDGYSDVIIGAPNVIVGDPNYDNGKEYKGKAFVYYGSVSGLSLVPDWTVESNHEFTFFGHSVSTAGDVNGDGYSDVIIGAPWHEDEYIDGGGAFVYYGSVGGLSQVPDWAAGINQSNANFGHSVSTAGDVNGDGYSDVIIGAYYYDDGEADEGGAFVYYGSLSGLSSTPDWTSESDQAGANFGYSVSTAGDVNGDGYSDVIIGAYCYDNGEENEGMAYVYYGSLSGLLLAPDWVSESNQTDAQFGTSVSTAGDVNGDGYSDVIIGAPWYDNGENNEGRAYVYYGNEGRSVVINAQQLREDFSVPVIPSLFTHSNSSFGLRYWAHSNYGRVFVKAQVEVKELGIPFDGFDLIETDWLDLDTTGKQISEVIDGLTLNHLYKWRARIKYHPKYGKSDIHSRWYYIQSNGLTECDFKVGKPMGISKKSPVISDIRLAVEYIPGGMRFIFNASNKQLNSNIVIYNLLGAEIDRIEIYGTGKYEWSGKYIPCGVYFARLVSDKAFSNRVKFILIK